MNKPVPKPRCGHSIVHLKDCVYSWGGYNSDIDQNDPELSNDPDWQVSKPLFKELWKLNLATKTWTRCVTSGEIPEQHAWHSAIMHPLESGVLLTFGGQGAQWTLSNTVTSCHLGTRTFTKLTVDGGVNEEEMPRPSWGQAVIRIFTVGGVDNNDTLFMDVYMLDLKQVGMFVQNEWSWR